jgi:hypothetical protein
MPCTGLHLPAKAGFAIPRLTPVVFIGIACMTFLRLVVIDLAQPT